MFGMIMGPIMLPLPAKGEHGRQDAEINGQHIAWYPCTTGWITEMAVGLLLPVGVVVVDS